MSEPTPTFNTLLEAAQVYPDANEARLHTKRAFMNCRRPTPCSGREVYTFQHDADKMGSTYECATCGHRFRIAVGGTFNF